MGKSERYVQRIALLYGVIDSRWAKDESEEGEKTGAVSRHGARLARHPTVTGDRAEF
jgi:hypothetical protein